MYGAVPTARAGGLSSASTFDLAAQYTSKAEGRWWEKRKEPLSAWQALVDKSGVEYYYNVETKDTTWDKPVELMTAAEADSQGEWYWFPSETECFVPARITQTAGTTITGVDAHGNTHTLKGKKKSDLTTVKRSSLQRVVPDLVLLDDMAAPLILHNLRARFLKKDIYTNVGTILIALNPYCALPLYSDEILRTYARRKLGQELPPHSYNVAHDAFVGLRDFSQNQSIVISGESGAGKTETTKHCLQYLAYMAGSASGVAAGILKTNPVLEAFGNAKTLRNDNSSRFGKFMQVFFAGRQCAMSGCMIKNYLLEKIRVVRQSGAERNFHIFYNLTKGADKDLRARLHGLQTPDKYRYLKTCTTVETIDDKKDWADVVAAFGELGVSAEEQERIYSIVAAVATLGNIDFEEDSNDYARVTTQEADSPVAVAAALLNVEPAVLARGLVVKELRIKNQETTVMKLNKLAASAQRDALAKFVYGYLFDWLVQRLNTAIGQPSDKSRFIGCLDIFGFEIFEQNSFEQLCINFTNEMLQQHFNYQTFKLEEAVYKAEGISFQHIEFIDNQPMLDLIAKRPHGLLPLLDEELIVPRGSDTGFLTKMNEHHARNAVYQRDSKRPTRFMIKHYAGLVAYEVDGFLEKNRDTLTEDLLDVLRTSKHALVNTLFPTTQTVSTAEKKASLGSQFRRQLDDLMTTLRLTEPHYIRCIKPNPAKAPTAFVPSMCNEQLTYSGVYEAVAIRKQGFPFRLRHEEFAERYSVLFDTDAPRGPVKDRCLAVLDLMKLDRKNVQLGATMVLYRAEEHKKLELHRNIKVRLTETHEDLERLVAINVSGYSDEERECYFIELAGAVRAADEFRLQTGAAVRARTLLDKFVEERMDPKTKKMLEDALASKSMNKLQAVLAVCEAHGYQTSIVRQCQELLERILDAEAALRVAKAELSEDFLTKAIAMCDAFDYASDSVEEARALLANMAQAKEMMRRAMASLNHEHLRKTLDFCESFGYRTAEVEACEAKLKQVMHVRELLTEARRVVEIVPLRAALEAADELTYDAPLVYECRLLHGRVVRIDSEADKAAVSLHERHVRAVLKAASEVGFKSKAVKKLRALADGPAAAYIQAQYTAAVKLGDHERAISISAGLKAQRVADRGEALALANFGSLKEPLSWGNEKWWGSAQLRADTMLSYTDAYIHAPLTRTLAAVYVPRLKQIQPRLLEAFENIQKMMGQRATKRFPQRVEEILMAGMETPELRDELYIVIMKQCNLNPLPEAVAKAFELLALCLITFPPSPDLEDYLFKFISADKYSAFNRQFNLEYLLCRICYLNAAPRPFWGCQIALTELAPVLARHLPRPRVEAKADVTPWDDLRVPFDDEEYKNRAREAYKRAKVAAKTAEAALAAQRRAWAADIDARTKAHHLRLQGIPASMAPPVSAPLESLLPEPVPEPVYAAPEPAPTRKGKKAGAAAAAAADDDEDDDSADVAPVKKGKKKAARAAAAAAAAAAAEAEPEEPAADAVVGKTKKGKKKPIAVVATAAEDEPEAEAAAGKTKKGKKKNKKAAVDDDGDAF